MLGSPLTKGGPVSTLRKPRGSANVPNRGQGGLPDSSPNRKGLTLSVRRPRAGEADLACAVLWHMEKAGLAVDGGSEHTQYKHHISNFLLLNHTQQLKITLTRPFRRGWAHFTCSSLEGTEAEKVYIYYIVHL